MLTTTRRGFLGASIVALAGLTGVGVGALPRRIRAGTFFPWEELAPGVWVTVSPTQGGNVVVAKGSEGSLVIDSKFAGMGPTLRREASDLAGPVRALINTHHHGDHTGGNVAFAEGVKTYAHEKARERIGEAMQQYMGQMRGAARQMGQDLDPKVQAELDALLGREGELEAGDWVPAHSAESLVKAEWSNVRDSNAAEVIPGLMVLPRHFGAGHTDNDLPIWLPKANVVHTGDLCFHNLHPYFDPSGGVTARGWVKSVRGIKANCDKDTKVVPGHGPVGGLEILDKQVAYLESLIEAVEKEVKAGKSKEEVAAMTWPFMDGLGFEQVRGRAIGAVYDEVKETK